MRDTNQLRERKKEKFYFFKYCDRCGKKYKPTSGGDYCNNCIKSRNKSK